jgi:biopolymer transport protein ExbD
MSKVKPKKKDTFIDMTAMSDVTVLLLTFFMLTAHFIPLEPIQVITPASVIETKVPEYNLATILIEPTGKVFLNLDRPDNKKQALEEMGKKYGVEFNAEEIANFIAPGTFAAVPMSLMKQYLALGLSDQKEFLQQHEGVPTDTIATIGDKMNMRNELAVWLKTAKQINADLAISVKADQDTPYPLVRNVTSTLQDIKENRFSLVTQLRGMPEGL